MKISIYLGLVSSLHTTTSLAGEKPSEGYDDITRELRGKSCQYFRATSSCSSIVRHSSRDSQQREYPIPDKTFVLL